ncbi:MAG TPA: recombinase family protein [Mycobacteriales bacterium]|nr:recombinase family protein [Mycobacteriales bacterium]
MTRRPVELEEFVATLDAAKVANVRFVTGDVDLATGDGLMFARMQGAIAAHEAAIKSARARRRMKQNAAAGLLPRRGGSTVRLRGPTRSSLRSLAVWLDAEESRLPLAVAH